MAKKSLIRIMPALIGLVGRPSVQGLSKNCEIHQQTVMDDAENMAFRGQG
jgi:hypothetical protein